MGFDTWSPETGLALVLGRSALRILFALALAFSQGCAPAGLSARSALSGLSGAMSKTSANPGMVTAGAVPGAADDDQVSQGPADSGKDSVLPGADAAAMPPGADTDRSKRAVLLIPGLAMPGASLAAMQAYLAGQGLAQVHTLDNPGGGITASIEACAEVVEARMRELAAQGIEAVDLVGHSMGGLVAREVVRRAATGLRVPVLVTVATPNHGNGEAAGILEKLGTPSAIGQMAAGSDFLRRLNAAPLPAGTRGYGLWTRSDEVVRPAESCRLPGGTDLELDVGGLGAHMAMGFHPTSLATVHRVLTRA